MMKKILITLFVFAILITPALSLAQDLIPCGRADQPDCDFRGFMLLINNIINFIFAKLVVPIAAVMFFYAGIKMMLSGGSPEGRTKAKGIFLNVLLGLIFAAASWLIIKAILMVVGYDDLSLFES